MVDTEYNMRCIVDCCFLRLYIWRRIYILPYLVHIPVRNWFVLQPFKMKSSDGWWSWPEKTTITKYKACFCRNKQENDIFNSNGLGPLTYESWSWEYNTVAWKQLRESDYQIIKPLGWFFKCFLQTTSKFIVIIKNLNFNCLFDLSQKLYLLSISFAKHHLSIGSMFVVPWLFQLTSNQTSFEIHRWQGIHNK